MYKITFPRAKERGKELQPLTLLKKKKEALKKAGRKEIPFHLPPPSNDSFSSEMPLVRRKLNLGFRLGIQYQAIYCELQDHTKTRGLGPGQ